MSRNCAPHLAPLLSGRLFLLRLDRKPLPLRRQQLRPSHLFPSKPRPLRLLRHFLPWLRPRFGPTRFTAPNRAWNRHPHLRSNHLLSHVFTSPERLPTTSFIP